MSTLAVMGEVEEFKKAAGPAPVGDGQRGPHCRLPRGSARRRDSEGSGDSGGAGPDEHGGSPTATRIVTPASTVGRKGSGCSGPGVTQ